MSAMAISTVSMRPESASVRSSSTVSIPGRPGRSESAPLTGAPSCCLGLLLAGLECTPGPHRAIALLA